LGFGFRCGFLGLLHMDIVQERLEREYGLNIIATAPSVAYQVVLTNSTVETIDSPAKLPPQQNVREVQEPWLELTIVTPERYVGPVMELISNRRGRFKHMDYIQKGAVGPSGGRRDATVVMKYALPLAEMLADFYDQLKSRTQGYASLDYNFTGFEAAPLVKLDILVNQQPVDALSVIVHKDQAYEYGKAIVERLRAVIPRQLFDVAVQAAIGSRVIARETVKAVRKDVLAKCYGGDITRKRKLLEKQREGKKRLKRVGNVEIPQEAFLTLLKISK
jgi:GTP-binding protein LepA